MKKTTKLIGLCAIAALPLGVVIAGDTTGNAQAPIEVKAEEASAEDIFAMHLMPNSAAEGPHLFSIK